MANTHRLLLVAITAFSAACGGGGSASPTSPTPTTSTPPPAATPPNVTMRVTVSRPASASAAAARPADVTIESPWLRFRTNINIEMTASGSGATVSGSCTPSSGITIEPSTPLTIPNTQISIGASSTMTINASGTLTLQAPVLISSNTVGTLDCRVTGTSTGGGIAVSASQTIDIPGSVLAANTAGCVPNSTTLCALNNRFQIQANAVHSSGQTSAGVVPSSSDRFNDGGTLRFFDDFGNDLLAGIVNQCGSSPPRFVVFAESRTNMEIRITVSDTQTGVSRRYVNPQGQRFQPVVDTTAFATCP